MQTNKIVINKETYAAEQAAGNIPAGLTFAKWRQEMKAKAEAENVPVVIGAMPTMASPAPVVDTAEVLEKVDEAIATATAAKVVATADTGEKKASYARAIFIEELEKQAKTGVVMVRKDVLKRFQMPISEGGASCTEKGANTYYQNLRKKYGLVAAK